MDYSNGDPLFRGSVICKFNCRKFLNRKTDFYDSSNTNLMTVGYNSAEKRLTITQFASDTAFPTIATTDVANGYMLPSNVVCNTVTITMATVTRLVTST